MKGIDALYVLFALWAKTSPEEYVREDPIVAFLNIDIAGRGFIGDDAGGTYFEFESIHDGIKQLQDVLGSDK